MIDENSEICIWKKAYEKQLAEEMQREDVREKGTFNYRERGCDKCEGNDINCEAYRDWLSLRKRRTMS